MATGSTTFHVFVSGNNNSVIIPYYLTQQFDLDDAITMPENPLIPDIAQRLDLDEAIKMPENPKTRLEEVFGMVSDMPEIDQAAGSCSVCMESFGKSEEIARRVSCGHVYHHNCITGWLLNGNGYFCPLCRREISGRSMI